MKILLISIVLLLVLPVPGYTCPVKDAPSDNFDEYEAIFTGEVTGIQLSEYQGRRLKELKDGDKYRKWFTDLTQQHEVTIIVTKVITGNVSDVKVITAGGCGIRLPKVTMDGVFFLRSDGTAIPIYADEGQYYSDYLIKLGKYSHRKLRKSK